MALDHRSQRASGDAIADLLLTPDPELMPETLAPPEDAPLAVTRANGTPAKGMNGN